MVFYLFKKIPLYTENMKFLKNGFKKWIQKYFLYMTGSFLLVASYYIGYQITYYSKEQKVAISVHASHPARGLASNQGKREIIRISNPEYSHSQNIFHKAQIMENEDVIQFVLGNMIFQDEKGNKSFVCQSFSEVDFLFEAEGLFIHGEPITMHITARCKSHSDRQWIGPFLIPAQEILDTPITQTTFESHQQTINFHNVSLFWPQTWILREVQFKNNNIPPLRVIADIPKTEDESFFTIQFNLTN